MDDWPKALLPQKCLPPEMTATDSVTDDKQALDSERHEYCSDADSDDVMFRSASSSFDDPKDVSAIYLETESTGVNEPPMERVSYECRTPITSRKDFNYKQYIKSMNNASEKPLDYCHKPIESDYNYAADDTTTRAEVSDGHDSQLTPPEGSVRSDSFDDTDVYRAVVKQISATESDDETLPMAAVEVDAAVTVDNTMQSISDPIHRSRMAAVMTELLARFVGYGCNSSVECTDNCRVESIDGHSDDGSVSLNTCADSLATGISYLQLDTSVDQSIGTHIDDTQPSVDKQPLTVIESPKTAPVVNSPVPPPINRNIFNYKEYIKSLKARPVPPPVPPKPDNLKADLAKLRRLTTSTFDPRSMDTTNAHVMDNISAHTLPSAPIEGTLGAVGGDPEPYGKSIADAPVNDFVLAALAGIPLICGKGNHMEYNYRLQMQLIADRIKTLTTRLKSVYARLREVGVRPLCPCADDDQRCLDQMSDAIKRMYPYPHVTDGPVEWVDTRNARLYRYLVLRQELAINNELMFNSCCTRF
ncbi:unnamed protein product [Medioppia subpectinata]|uniref:Uncharacterized protein n=1 Tax=Medioppia subpectinata TaxID=1979941 RepID=A0A7R9PZF8_9ACAR|nr:unnamed protein product [Medioppia subpectinata]CAG2106440.1 unnamed protein product [Medioppia subpectinata]